MTLRRAHLVALLYAVADAAIVMAPSIVLAVTARKGGLPQSHGLDLVAVSAVLGLVHAAVAFVRLTNEALLAARGVDVWIAAFDALVVLALGGTLLLVAVLGAFAEQHAALINRGWSLVWLWIGVQAVAMVLAEVTGRSVFRWLERAVPEDARRPPTRGAGVGDHVDDAELRARRGSLAR